MTVGCIRHKIQQKDIKLIYKKIYIKKKHLENYNLIEDKLRRIINNDSEKFSNMLGRIQKFNANIIGSNTYFFKRRTELEVLIEQEEMCIY